LNGGFAADARAPLIARQVSFASAYPAVFAANVIKADTTLENI
jgi:hypothetical protein